MKKDTDINILLIEDDLNLGPFLQTYLTAKGYSCFLANDGEKGIDAFLTGKYNFCITDVMLPLKDGFSVAKEIRKHNSSIPILFLTAKTLEEDRLKGFQVGGDDYISKPFSIEELILRIQAIIRRTQSIHEAHRLVFKIGRLTFDFDRQVVITPQGEIKLTTRESELLRLLSQYQNEIVYRNVALTKIWKEDSVFNARSMDVYITKIRKILKADPNVELINIHGVGFKLSTSKK